jgi:hypothetical protein
VRPTTTSIVALVLSLDIGVTDAPRGGGKSVSLGEVFRTLQPKEVGVLDGFVTTADAYWSLLATQDLAGRRRPAMLAHHRLACLRTGRDGGGPFTQADRAERPEESPVQTMKKHVAKQCKLAAAVAVGRSDEGSRP